MKIIATLFILFTCICYSFGQVFPNSNTDGKYYTVNGAKIWTVRVGDGPPVFLIPGGPGGAHHRVAVPWMAVQYKEYCPQAEFHLIEKSGHNAFVEEPQKTFEIIRSFLRK